MASDASAQSKFNVALMGLYFAGQLGTFIKLTFFDCYAYTWWNWILVVPFNAFLATIWPAYWAILRPLFGDGGC